MGSCISTCRPSPFSAVEPSVPQDKLVISQSPAISFNPVPEDFYKKQQAPSSSSSSSSTSTNSSSCSSFFSPKNGSFSSECTFPVHRSSQIVVLDPGKHSRDKPKPVRFPVQASQQPISAPSQQSNARISKALPSKRTRSSSPTSLGRQKSFRGEHSSVAPSPSLQSSLSFPSGRLARGACRDVTKNAVKEQQRHGVQRSRTVTPRPLIASKEKLRPLDPDGQSSCIVKEASERRIQQIQPQVGQCGSGEMPLKQRSSRNHFMENFDNPLISMDCFIFL